MSQNLLLAIQATYQNTQVCLLDSNHIIIETQIGGNMASSQLIPAIAQILTQANLQLQDLKFFAIDLGPGAFTSVRVGVVTINGLALSSNIPILGINGLEGFAQLHTQPEKYTFALLNAYSQEVYVTAQFGQEILLAPTCLHIDQLIEFIQSHCPKQSQLLFTGNGIISTKEKLELLKSEYQIEFGTADVLTATQVGQTAWQAFEQKKLEPKPQVMPIYIKENMRFKH